MKTALVLSGGGARAAYQVGVLKAIAELIPDTGHNPFQIICGTSSGAINAVKLATEADHFHRSVANLDTLWSNIQPHNVHHVGIRTLLKGLLKLFASFFHSGLSEGKPLSLLDNEPLYQLLLKNVDMTRLNDMIDKQQLHALCIAALGYSSGHNISFIQGHSSIEGWTSARRSGVKTTLTHNHIMASAALPAIFPSVRLNREYFGDGALRQTAPLSSALNLGAKKLFVIGVSGNSNLPYEREKINHSPSIAQVLSQLLNSAFIDSLEEDVDMVKRINTFSEALTKEKQKELNVNTVGVLVIEPTIKFDDLAGQYIQNLPRSMRGLLKIIGANSTGGGSSLASYILFEKEYCRALINGGYQDAMDQSEKIREFIGSCIVQ
jgi:NTE family protein